MSMARRQRRHLDIWPGFVDALGAMLAVILFLLLFTGLAWLLKREFWKDVH